MSHHANGIHQRPSIVMLHRATLAHFKVFNSIFESVGQLGVGEGGAILSNDIPLVTKVGPVG
eukprot:173770-Amphidinium_carterae.1